MKPYRTMRATALLLLLTGSPAVAQNATPSPSDTTVNTAEEVWKFIRGRDYRPYLEAGYGYGLLSHQDFSADLPTMGVLQAKLGY